MDTILNLIVAITLYVSPRYGRDKCYDVGIHQYNLFRESIKVPFKDRPYDVRIPFDSVHVLYYRKITSMPDIQWTGAEVPADSVGTSRIMMIIEKDTCYLDASYILTKEGHSYKATPAFIDWLEHQMPADLNDNWKNHSIVHWQRLR